jgi:hypothetical protein
MLTTGIAQPCCPVYKVNMRGQMQARKASGVGGVFTVNICLRGAFVGSVSGHFTAGKSAPDTL